MRNPLGKKIYTMEVYHAPEPPKSHMISQVDPADSIIPYPTTEFYRMMHGLKEWDRTATYTPVVETKKADDSDSYRRYIVNMYKTEIAQAEANGMRLSEYRLFRNSIDPKIDAKFAEHTTPCYITEYKPRYRTFEEQKEIEPISKIVKARLEFERLLRMSKIVVPYAAKPAAIYECHFYGDSRYVKVFEAVKELNPRLNAAVSVLSENTHTKKALCGKKHDDEVVKMLIVDYITKKAAFDLQYPLTYEHAYAWWDKYFNTYVKSRHYDEEREEWVDCFTDRPKLSIVRSFFNAIWYNYTKYCLIKNGYRVDWVFVPYHDVHYDIIRKGYWSYNENAQVVLCHLNGEFEQLSVEGYRQFIKSKMYNKYETMPFLEELPTDSGYYRDLRTLENWLEVHEYDDRISVHEPYYSFEYEQFKINRLFGDEVDDYVSDGDEEDDGFVKRKGIVSEKENATYHLKGRSFKFVIEDLVDIVCYDENSKTYFNENERMCGKTNHIVVNPTLDVLKRSNVMIGDCGRVMHQLGLDPVYQCKQYNWILVDIEHLCYENGNIVYTCPVCGKQNIIPGTPTLSFQTICSRCEAIINFQAGIPNLRENPDPVYIDPNWIGTDDEEADTRTTFKFGGDAEEDY